MGNIEKAAGRMTDLDAAGIGIITLRCDNESDIRRTVEKYVHAAPYKENHGSNPGNIKEVTGLETVKSIFLPFSWQEHTPAVSAAGDPDYGAEPSLMHFLSLCTDAKTRLAHRLLYIPRLYDVIGSPDRSERSNIHQQYLYMLREIGYLKSVGKSNALIVIGCTDGILCPELREYDYVLDIEYPDKEELVDMIRKACINCAGRANGLETAIANELAEVSRGLRRDEVKRIINLAYAQNENPFNNRAENLLKAVKEAKRQKIEGVRGLRWIDAENADEVGGLEALRKWIEVKSRTFMSPHAAQVQKVTAPKGILIAGLPGCGKTMLARYTSRILSGPASGTTVPLLQLDISSLLGKWLGEAEANCEMALRAVESVAPCVLLVDEIEKYFGNMSQGGSNDAMMHIFASFLDWMQKDRDKPVLVIATANNTESLPAELKRKGRFDETFFTGIPTADDCREIFRIHLRKKESLISDDGFEDGEDRKKHREDLINELIDTAAGEKRFMNGADIETIVNAAFCTLFANLEEADMNAIENARMNDAAPKRYSLSEVRDALTEELKATRSYFDNNLSGAARYWLEMNQLNFRDAGGKNILPQKGFDPDTGRFLLEDRTDAEHPESDQKDKKEGTGRDPYEKELRDRIAANSGTNGANYDEALKYTLMLEIYRQRRGAP